MSPIHTHTCAPAYRLLWCALASLPNVDAMLVGVMCCWLVWVMCRFGVFSCVGVMSVSSHVMLVSRVILVSSHVCGSRVVLVSSHVLVSCHAMQWWSRVRRWSATHLGEPLASRVVSTAPHAPSSSRCPVRAWPCGARGGFSDRTPTPRTCRGSPALGSLIRFRWCITRRRSWHTGAFGAITI